MVMYKIPLLVEEADLADKRSRSYQKSNQHRQRVKYLDSMLIRAKTVGLYRELLDSVSEAIGDSERVEALMSGQEAERFSFDEAIDIYNKVKNDLSDPIKAAEDSMGITWLWDDDSTSGKYSHSVSKGEKLEASDENLVSVLGDIGYINKGDDISQKLSKFKESYSEAKDYLSKENKVKPGSGSIIQFISYGGEKNLYNKKIMTGNEVIYPSESVQGKLKKLENVLNYGIDENFDIDPNLPAEDKAIAARVIAKKKRNNEKIKERSKEYKYTLRKQILAISRILIKHAAISRSDSEFPINRKFILHTATNYAIHNVLAKYKEDSKQYK